MSFQRLNVIETDHADSVYPSSLGHLENTDSPSQGPHRTPETHGVLVRRPKPVCLLLKRLPRWLVTAGVVGGILCVLSYYSKKPVMSKASERWFNVWITSLSIALGLAISSGLNGAVSDLRWRILSRRYRSRRKIERILKADSMLDLIRLACRSRRPTIHAAVMSWIILLLISQIAVASLGLCYSTKDAERQALVVPGEVLIANMSSVQTNKMISDHSADVGGQQYVSNNYGIISSAYPVGDIRDRPSPGTIFIEGDVLIYAADLWRYVFRETSVKSMGTDDTKALSVVSPRSISAGAACRSWRVVQGGNGSQPMIVVAMEQGDTRIDLPLAGGTNQTTYMINTTQSCGPGCSQISAFEASHTAPWYYMCNVTVSAVANASRPEHEASLDLRLMTSGAIALQGYDVSSLVNETTLQFQTYPVESIYGATSSGNTSSMALVVSRFAIGAVATAAETNAPITLQGTAPQRGEVLEIKKYGMIYLILLGIVVTQFIIEVAVGLWAHQVAVPPKDTVGQAQVLRSMMYGPTQRGSFNPPGTNLSSCKSTGELWIYRTTATETEDIFDCYMERFEIGPAGK